MATISFYLPAKISIEVKDPKDKEEVAKAIKAKAATTHRPSTVESKMLLQYKQNKALIS